MQGVLVPAPWSLGTLEFNVLQTPVGSDGILSPADFLHAGGYVLTTPGLYFGKVRVYVTSTVPLVIYLPDATNGVLTCLAGRWTEWDLYPWKAELLYHRAAVDAALSSTVRSKGFMEVAFCRLPNT